MMSFRKKLGCAIFMVFLMVGNASALECFGSAPPVIGDWVGERSAEYAEDHWGEKGKVIGKVIRFLFVKESRDSWYDMMVTN